jgi:hypothetical protein
MIAVLELVAGPTPGTRTEIGPGQIVEIGRAAHGGLAIPGDRHMSARHFAVLGGDEGCRLRDLGSTNGTFVNGSRVTEALLGDGDSVLAGNCVFRVRLGLRSPSVVADGPGSAEALPAVTEKSDDVRGASPLPLLDVVNQSPFPAAMLRWEDGRSQPRLTVIVKATFALARGTETAREQRPILGQDAGGEGGGAAIRYESDLVPFKPRADVVLVGRAHAPGGRPVAQLMAGFKVGPLLWTVAVFGDRRWEWRGLGEPVISGPEPFASMELTYERAFGGIDPSGGMYCPENLVGTGFIGKKTRERVHGLALPNLEDPGNLIRSWDSRPVPIGCGFYGRGWRPRLAYAGTYDEGYRRERSPAPPADFAYEFFNGAHPALQVDGYLRGDEEVRLVNLCPGDGDLGLRLPGVVPTITVARWATPAEEWLSEHLGADGTLPPPPLVEETVRPVLDTLIFVPDEGIFCEVFRGSCGLSTVDSLEVARITIRV